MPMPGRCPAAAPSFCCDAHRKPMEPTSAPSFPAAPDRPWQVDRKRAGKSSAGRMKVVVLGPRLAEKKRAAVVGDVEEEPRRRAREQVSPMLPDEAAREEAVRRARRRRRRHRRRAQRRRRHLFLGDGGQVEVGQDAADVVGGLHHVALHQRLTK
ncbi:Os06g0324601 [Oryza sativa Japonica Group]|uniref:Os06g0324601 protein n=1 Tax=Oryza sativa subsp. japonica TaxID=39947 RepID=A0A0P0WW03_ORYSJ|nr:hypothetical protein EE612_033763 [Oryza sativa]BAS97519.1 Os06g0324601 [Oryza sativa Japonica Group]